jgi:hypothetical protein
VLAGIGIEEPLKEGNLQGEINDKFSWRASVSVYQEEQSESSDGFNEQQLPFTPYHVVVEVFWETGSAQIRSVILETLRLALNEE